MPKLVSILCALAALAAMPLRAATTVINPTATYQTIEGLGGATCFWVGNLSGHPYKMEIYTNIFAGLNLSMLRVGDWYRYQSSLNTFDSAASGVVARTTNRGRSVAGAAVVVRRHRRDALPIDEVTKPRFARRN